MFFHNLLWSKLHANPLRGAVCVGNTADAVLQYGLATCQYLSGCQPMQFFFIIEGLPYILHDFLTAVP